MKKRLPRLDWDVNAGNTATQLSTPQPSPGWIEVSTRVKLKNCRGTVAEQAKMTRLPTFSCPKSRRRNTIPRRKKSRKPDRTTPSRPPPCGTCRHSAAAPPYTIRQSENHQIWTSRRLPRRHNRDDTTRRGLATPAVRPPPRSRRLAEDTASGGLATSATVLYVADPFLKSPLG